MNEEFHSFYKTVNGGEGDRCNYPTRLDMYGKGCQHNCQYCYARALLGFRGLWNPEEPARADPKEVEKVLDTIPADTVLRLGGMTDPFQPCEKEYKLTEWLIGELNQRNIRYLIVTKNASVADCKVIDPKLAHVQVSITSTEGKAPKNFERASPPEERFEAVESLMKRDIDVQMRLSPFIPMLYDMDRVLECSCPKVLVEFLRVNTFIKRTFPSMKFTEYKTSCGNYKGLSLDRKIRYLKPLFGKKELSVCEDIPEHYDYFRNNINANPWDCCNLRHPEGWRRLNLK